MVNSRKKPINGGRTYSSEVFQGRHFVFGQAYEKHELIHLAVNSCNVLMSYII